MSDFFDPKTGSQVLRTLLSLLLVLLLVLRLFHFTTVQSLSCGGRECARRRESLASLCTDCLCKDNWWSWLRCLRLHLVLQLTLLLAYVFDLLFRQCGLGPDTIDFGFGFRPIVTFYFRWHIRFRPNVLRHFWPTFGFGRKYGRPVLLMHDDNADDVGSKAYYGEDTEWSSDSNGHRRGVFATARETNWHRSGPWWSREMLVQGTSTVALIISILRVTFSTVWVKSPLIFFWRFFPNGSEFLVQILYAYYTFLSTLDYKFVFNYLHL